MLFRCLATIQNHEQLQPALPSSAFAVAAAVRTSCSSVHLNFSGHFDCKGLSSMRPSMELLSLCSDLVRESDRKLLHKISLTIYARTPECYGGDALEFRKLEDDLLLLFTSDIKATFQEVEGFLAQRRAIELPDFNALVVPLTKELCLVGFLVAERVSNAFQGVPPIDDESSVIDLHPTSSVFSIAETEELVRLAQTLASACVMDQRVALLQHASWQKSVKVDSFLEQARGSLTALRTLGKLLLPHVRKGEIARDVLQDMLLQSDRIKDVVEEIQEVLYRSMAMGDQDDEAAFDSSEEWKAPQRQLQSGSRSSHTADKELRDSEAPMPPLALAAIDSSCVVAEVICELGQALNRLASKKNIQVEVRVEAGAETLAAAVDEEALRQAVSKLLDNAMQRKKGGSDAWIRVKVSEAPGSGGVLVVIEDNGIDMSLVMQSRAMGPLGPGIKGGISLGLDVKLARELLECYGVVLRITSPFLRRLKNAGGGMRVEIWLPSSSVDYKTVEP